MVDTVKKSHQNMILTQSDDIINLQPQYYLNTIVYSKDRPYQLSQFLESFYKIISCEGLDVHLNILYTYTSAEFEKYYDGLKLRFRESKTLRWHKEDGTVDQIL